MGLCGCQGSRVRCGGLAGQDSLGQGRDRLDFPEQSENAKTEQIQCLASLVRLVRPRRRVIGNYSRVVQSGDTFPAVHDLRYSKGR